MNKKRLLSEEILFKMVSIDGFSLTMIIVTMEIKKPEKVIMITMNMELKKEYVWKSYFKKKERV